MPLLICANYGALISIQDEIDRIITINPFKAPFFFSHYNKIAPKCCDKPFRIWPSASLRNILVSENISTIHFDLAVTNLKEYSETHKIKEFPIKEYLPSLVSEIL